MTQIKDQSSKENEQEKISTNIVLVQSQIKISPNIGTMLVKLNDADLNHAPRISVIKAMMIRQNLLT